MSGKEYTPQQYVQIKHPHWCKNATIYEVNIRQYTKEGTFRAFEAHLQRLKDLGIDILWLMPIHPIGKKNRKGNLGSYYSVKDYRAVNPEFGSLDDFKALVRKIHNMEMYVIIDWVANHSAWDNVLVDQHPGWYSKDQQGHFHPTRWRDWSDVIDFDYDQPGLRQYMTEALKYWVKEMDIDGYRCDVAGFVPIEFWENARRELDAIKPVFMLAEWESRDLHKRAFDATYGWTLWDTMHAVTTQGRPLGALLHYLADYENAFPEDAIKMNFIDNHDKNSWFGTPFKLFGDGLQASMVWAATVPGMPLVYSGQEAGLDRKLSFFDKDEIVWQEHPFTEMYKKLFKLKHENQALWNGSWGGRMDRIVNNKPQQVLSFVREKNGDKVIVVINYSSRQVKVTLQTESHTGDHREIFTDKTITLIGNDSFILKAWEYLVLATA